ncbi:MAG: hypothetical protein Q9200_004090 [Gallowayella weberi]
MDSTAWPEGNMRNFAAAVHKAFLANPVTNAEAQTITPNDILVFIKRERDPKPVYHAMELLIRSQQPSFLTRAVLIWMAEEQKDVSSTYIHPGDATHCTYNFNAGIVREQRRFRSHLAAYRSLFSQLSARSAREPPLELDAADEETKKMGIWQDEMAALLLKAKAWVEEMEELETKVPEVIDYLAD